MKKIIFILSFISVLSLVACSDGFNVETPIDDNSSGEEEENIRVFEIKLLGTNVMYLQKGSMYVEHGSSASDSVDGNVDSEIFTIKINGDFVNDVDTNIIGTYEIIYRAINSNNDVRTITRSVDVYEKNNDNSDFINKDDDRILNEIYLNQNSSFQTIISNANPGDAFIFEDGIYDDLEIELKTNGTENNPIFIIPDNSGKAIISGVSKIEISSDFAIFSGFMFQNGYPVDDKGVIDVDGNNVRINNNKILNYENLACGINVCDKWISIKGQNNEIDRNHLEGKTTSGALLTIWREPGKEDNHHIHHNYFKDYTNPNSISNGLEGIRIGTSNDSQSNSFTTVENNIFESMDGEIELISIKSGSNIIRGNMLLNSSSMITSRHGKNNLIENNIIIGNGKSNTGGIRVYDSGHIIRNNYIEGISTTSNTRGGIVIHSGVNDPGVDTTLNAQWTANDISVENNTVYDSRQSILFDDKYDFGPKDIRIKNNFIYSSSNSIFRYDTNGLNNIYESTHIFTGNSFYSLNNINEGNGVLNNLSFENYAPNIKIENNIKYHEDSGIGAKNLVYLNNNDVGISW